MTSQSSFKTFGVFVPDDVYEALESHLEAEAGVIEFEDYFDPNSSTVPRGDPAAELTHLFCEGIRSEFASLYDAAEFEAARQVGHDEFRILTLATTPKTVIDLKDLFRAASRIQQTDSRTVHTAILRTALEERALPDLPENTVTFEESS